MVMAIGIEVKMQKRMGYWLMLLMAISDICSGSTPLTDDLTKKVRTYIESTWNVLVRDTNQLDWSHSDDKLNRAQTILYVSRKENLQHVKNRVASRSKTSQQHLIIRILPESVSKIHEHGLLYLPYPYVVPGGRFNEMYGWDSYFIQLGLLESGKVELAKYMVDNLIYEIHHYGTILNANRTYYLQRSQPPLLTGMILAYYRETKDKKWLKATLPAINKFYQFWISPPHLNPETGLSRYYAQGEGPAPEESAAYYEHVLRYFKTHDIRDYDKSLYYDKNSETLTKAFYIADRTVRESGLDISNKYGPFGAAIVDYIPVDLNVFLYQMEKETAEIYTILKNPQSAALWQKRANVRAARINQYLWDKPSGFYFDYNYKTRQLRPYLFATTLYPLWAGLATKEQAQAVVKNLPRLLGKGGLLASPYKQGVQWDAPFGWAPMHYFAVEGLKRYGYHVEALDLAKRFVNTVNKGFAKAQVVFEKYDVLDESIHTAGKIHYSYTSNEVGFGWTNAVYLLFLKELSAS